MLPAEPAFKIYADLDGSPLDSGYVYFGQVNQNPITAPVTVYWDAAGTQPAVQPLRTLNGYIVRNGTPANVFVSGNYSQLVRDKNQSQIYYSATSTDYSIADVVTNFITALASSTGATLVGFLQTGVGAVLRNVLLKLLDYEKTPFDFGGVGNGIADDSDAIQKCVTAGNTLIPTGNWRITKTIFIPDDRYIRGMGRGSRVFSDATFVPTVMGWAGGPLPIMFANSNIVASGAGKNINIKDIFSDWTSEVPGLCHHVHLRNTTGCKVDSNYFKGGADATAFTLSSNYEVTNNDSVGTKNCAYDQWENSHDGLVQGNSATISFGYGMLATGDTSLNTPGQTSRIKFLSNNITGDGTSNSGVGLWLQSGSNATSTCSGCIAIGNRLEGFDVGMRATGGGHHIMSTNQIYNAKKIGISLSSEVAGFGSKANNVAGNIVEVSGDVANAPIFVQDNSDSNVLEANRVVNNNGALYGLVLAAASTGNYVVGNLIDPGATGTILDQGNNTVSITHAYTEGLFTPTLASSGGGLAAYAVQYGSYQRIGNRVHFNVRISLTSTNTLAAGTLTINGMPFTSRNFNSNDVSPFAVVASNLNGALANPPLARMLTGVTQITMLKWVGGTSTGLLLSDITNTAELNVSGSFSV